MKKLCLLILCAAGAAHAESNAVFLGSFEPAGSCPAGRIESTMMSWRYDGIGRRIVDVTRAENIWGRGNAGAPTVPFPWMNVFSLFWSFPRNGYVAAQFDVPLDVPSWSFGMFTHGETIPGPATDMAISARCGDFNPAHEYCQMRGKRAGHQESHRQCLLNAARLHPLDQSAESAAGGFVIVALHISRVG